LIEPHFEKGRLEGFYDISTSILIEEKRYKKIPLRPPFSKGDVMQRISILGSRRPNLLWKVHQLRDQWDK